MGTLIGDSEQERVIVGWHDYGLVFWRFRSDYEWESFYKSLSFLFRWNPFCFRNKGQYRHINIK